MRHIKRLCLAALAALGGSFPAHAGVAHQSHASILRVAETHVQARADQFVIPPVVESGSLDSRLRLPRCDQPLQTYDSPGGLKAGNSVVGVRCTGSRPWKLYVPVKIQLRTKVVAAARPLRRGEIVARGDLILLEKDLAQLHGAYFRDPAQVIGRRVRRTLREQRVISPAAVEVRKLVKRGGEVMIQSSLSGIQVQMRGKALADGGQGERIRVKNLSSGRELAATVIGPGVVRVSR